MNINEWCEETADAVHAPCRERIATLEAENAMLRQQIADTEYLVESSRRNVKDAKELGQGLLKVIEAKDLENAALRKRVEAIMELPYFIAERCPEPLRIRRCLSYDDVQQALTTDDAAEGEAGQ